ncbi:hypothetical protein TWF281_009742 [Arthrobotrys megalospora]
MNVNLQSIQDTGFEGAEQQSIFNAFRITLQSPLDVPAKTAQIADELSFRYAALGSPSSLEDCLWETWVVLVEIVSIIPPDHEWQGILVNAIKLIREKNLGANGGGPNDKAQLKELAGLPDYIRDAWFDPTDPVENIPTDFEPEDYHDDGDDDPAEPEEAEQIEPEEDDFAGPEEDPIQRYFKWKNLNSFVARLTSEQYNPWFNLPIWQLRTALEYAPIRGAAMDTRIWVASEWILQCGKLVFEQMTSGNELDEESAAILETGTLSTTDKALSLERWQFWRDRFLFLSGSGSDLDLDAAVVQRARLAAQKMDGIRVGNSI